MIGSLFAAIGPAVARRAQSAHSFGNNRTPTPGSHGHLHKGVLTASVSPLLVGLTVGLLFGRAGRSGSAAAWPGARSTPSRRVAPRKGAGK